MSDREDIALRMSAFALAGQARVGAVDPLDLADLYIRAEQHLESSDPLFRAITGFVTALEVAEFDHEARRAAGEDLQHAIEVINMPEPPGQDRRDING